MSINGPIEKVDNFVLCARNTDTSRVEIEGHVLVTLNAHELVVESQDRVTQWPFLEVSPHFFQCHIIFFINRCGLLLIGVIVRLIISLSYITFLFKYFHIVIFTEFYLGVFGFGKNCWSFVGN